MRKFIAIIIALSVVAGSVHLDELSKLPMLIRHYTEHKALHQEDTVFGFLYDHYILNPETATKNDQSHHSKLPFKSTKSVHQHMGFFTVGIHKLFLNSHFMVEMLFPDTGLRIISGFSSIWQPPKLG